MTSGVNVEVSVKSSDQSSGLEGEDDGVVDFLCLTDQSVSSLVSNITPTPTR